MYRDLILSLPLEYTGITFNLPLEIKNSRGEVIPPGRIKSSTTIEETGLFYAYSPRDYAIRGKLIPGYKNLSFKFNIDLEGPHILFITGIPKGLTIEESKLYHFDKALKKCYWQDTKIGYLTQVIEWDRFNKQNK